jgi:MFS family permease
LSEPASDSSADPAPSSHGTTTGWAAFRTPSFGFFIIVRIINGMSGVMLQLAIGWEVWRIFQDELILGLIGLALFAPNLLFFLVTGTVADRFARQRIMAASYVSQAVCSYVLMVVLSDPMPSMPLVYAILFLLGTARAFSQPAQQSILPTIVPTHHFSNGVAWSSSAHQLAVVIGPMIAGALLLLGAAVVFKAVSCGLLVGAFFILIVRTRGQEKARGPVTLESLMAGIRYIYNRQVILGAITLDLFAVIFGSVNALLPVYVTDVLHTGPEGLGLLRASLAIGAVTCGLALTHIPVKRNAGRILLISVGVYGLATLLFGISTSLYLSIGALALAGVADMVSVFIRASMIQLATPDEMRGRVASVHGMFTNASGQLGDFRAGSVAAVLGAVPSVAIGAACTAALAVLWAWKFPRLRNVDALAVESLREDADRGR